MLFHRLLLRTSLLALLLVSWAAPAGLPAAPAITRSICRIQGEGLSSGDVGGFVTTTGVVYADLDAASERGFYLQHDGCDNKASTSNGIFVQISERVDIVAAGDRVEVTGAVQEYNGRTQMYVNTSRINILSRSNPLPAALDLAPPANNAAAPGYFESLEGMYVRLDAARVVGPTDDNARTWVVRLDLGIERVFESDPAGTGEVICVAGQGLFAIAPPATAGDTVSNLIGPLDFQWDDYCIQLLAPPVLTSTAPVSPSAVDSLPGLTVATFNLAELNDALDDPLKDETVLTGPEYQRRLYKRARAIHDVLGEPAILAVQEVENRAVLDALVKDTDVLRSDYQIVWVDGPDRRGLDSALLYRADRVWAFESYVRQGCTSLVDGLGPDGNDDPLNPINTFACDTNGDDLLDGNRLFSRPPLVVRLGLSYNTPGAKNLSGDRNEVWVIVCHLKSKVQDTQQTLYTLPRRIEQARFVVGLADEIHAAHPTAGLLVMGDFNDSINSAPLRELTGAGFVDLSQQIMPPFRYTYIYKGVSQTLDHILWRPSLVIMPQAVTVAHINADFPPFHTQNIDTSVRSSDHDPLWARFGVPTTIIWLPLVTR